MKHPGAVPRNCPPAQLSAKLGAWHCDCGWVRQDTSAGFFGTVLALQLCGKVDIYGFTQRSGHYFSKLDRSKAPLSARPPLPARPLATLACTASAA